MTVRRLLLEIDSRELTEWMAYAQLEPWDETRADLRTGILASLIANVNRRKRGKIYKPKDFMLEWKTKRKTMDINQQLAQVEMLNSIMGGKDLRGNTSQSSS